MRTIQTLFAGIGTLGAIFTLSACAFLTQAGTVMTGIEIPGPSLWLIQGDASIVLNNGQPIETEQGKLGITLKPFPPRQKNKIELYLEDKNTQPINNAGVTIQCEMLDMTHEIAPIPAIQKEEGHYSANLELPMKGLWQLKIAITRPEGGQTHTYLFNLRNDFDGGGGGGHLGH